MVEIELLESQAGQLRDPKAAGVKQLQHGPVAQGIRVAARGTGQQALHLAGRERAGNAPHQLRPREQFRDIAIANPLPHEMAGKHPQRGQLAGEAANGELLLAQAVDPVG